MPEHSWSVVSTVREPLPLVLAFACHHLSLGAQTVHLFFDDPDDPAAPILAAIPGVEVTLCDAAHWNAFELGKRPAWQTRRQTLNANLVAQRQQTDWLLHADADEFLWAPDGIEADLSRADTWLHIPNLERVWTAPESAIFDGVFRAPGLPRWVREQAYGASEAYLQSGLSGHASGKTMARLSQQKFIGIHAVKEKFHGKASPGKTTAQTRILHFDGMTARHWLLKSLRYAAQGKALLHSLHTRRRIGIERVINANDPLTTGRALHAEIFQLSDTQQELLRAHDALLTCPLHLEQTVASLAPEVAVDFSAEQFDAPLAPALDEIIKKIRK
ncbi:glycosyltransferase family 2 protein [Aliiroseovarius sp. PrR006]|uniref:glycosyltransferase family 2 protein n=1 Tax=Aliiroseovarius sp. PrR006 TaxID=2706883 RepID=UPI0013D63837|nr:glycosyltransferase family 2 protein [Aliiroseovarius sp. PrR006]NDW53929.1 glycosyltransferase family 2 protein [Aliiroseovarius sp. PrR006]